MANLLKPQVYMHWFLAQFAPERVVLSRLLILNQHVSQIDCFNGYQVAVIYVLGNYLDDFNLHLLGFLSGLVLRSQK